LSDPLATPVALHDDGGVRLALAAVTAVVLVCVSQAAAGVAPKGLVLSQADLPAGFRLDRGGTGVRSNASESTGQPEVRRMFARSGRVTGYEAQFDRGLSTIESRADLFRRADGAQLLFRWFVREVKVAGITGLKRSRADVGAEGWLYTSPSMGTFTLVVWRHDRVFAGVVARGISRERTLTLARVQQRRIASALR
jgi:hypothetical protein